MAHGKYTPKVRLFRKDRTAKLITLRAGGARLVIDGTRRVDVMRAVKSAFNKRGG